MQDRYLLRFAARRMHPSDMDIQSASFSQLVALLTKLFLAAIPVLLISGAVLGGLVFVLWFAARMVGI